MKALAKDSEERYQLAKDLLIDLRNLKQEMELQAKLHAVSAGRLERRDAGCPTVIG